MNKLLILFIFLITPFYCFGMEKLTHKSDPNKTDDKGQTALHRVVLMSEEDGTDFEHIDAVKAHKVAELLMQHARLDIADNYQRTPFDYAELNKHILPTVFEVVMAAKLMMAHDPKTAEFKKAQATLVEHYLTMNS